MLTHGEGEQNNVFSPLHFSEWGGAGGGVVSKLGVTVVILCGGIGSRLGALVSETPKPLLTVQGKPFLEHVISFYEAQNVKRFVFCTGYLSNRIQDHFSDPEFSHLDISFSVETEALGTGGAITHALPHIKSDHFLVINGDSFCSFSLENFLEFHHSHEAIFSMALRFQEDCSRYGSVALDESEGVISFEEKRANAGSGLINAGVYLLSKSVYSQLDLGKTFSIETDVFPKFISHDLFGFDIGDVPFIDIGTPVSLQEAETFPFEFVSD